MIRYFSFEKELRAVESRQKRGRIEDKVDFIPVCIVHQTPHPDTLDDGSEEKRRVSGVIYRGRVLCLSQALAEARKENPNLTDPDFVKNLKLYREDLVQHLYIYDAAPAASSNNHHH